MVKAKYTPKSSKLYYRLFIDYGVSFRTFRVNKSIYLLLKLYLKRKNLVVLEMICLFNVVFKRRVGCFMRSNYYPIDLKICHRKAFKQLNKMALSYHKNK